MRTQKVEGNQETFNESNAKKVYAITSTYGKGGRGSMIELIGGNHAQATTIGQGGKTGLYAISSSGRSWGRESRAKFGESNTINTGQGGNTQSNQTIILEEKNRIRRLTPIECERLQGFPDNWTAGLSDSQRYKCLGNAVTTNVITALGLKLLQSKGEVM